MSSHHEVRTNGGATWWAGLYQDQWLITISDISLQFADSQKNQDHPLNTWLTHYRKRLITKPRRIALLRTLAPSSPAGA